MKSFITIIILLFCTTVLIGQRTFNEAIQLGDKALKNGQFDEAINYYFAAEAFAPNNRKIVRKRIKKVFDAINRVKIQAEKDKQAAIKSQAAAEKARQEAVTAKKLAEFQKQQAEQEKEKAIKAEKRMQKALISAFNINIKNQRLIDALYFFRGRFARTYNGKKFGFIDNKGEVLIKHLYDEADNFDNTGFAKVKRDGLDYLLDTLGNEYRVAYNVVSLNSEDIVALDTRGIQLDSFPTSILGHKSLEILILNGEYDKHKKQITNNFKTIPNEINQLTNLKSLHLTYCQIDSLPTFKNLDRLQTIDLSNNEKITRIRGIGMFKSLRNLKLRGNSIKKIENLDSLSALKLLDLSSNKYIEKIENLENCKQLQTLYLSNNSIKNIEGLDSLIHLRALFLSKNNIDKIKGLEHLRQLQFLYLSSNNIRKIENLDSLSQLNAIYLYNNEISKMEGLSHLKKLKYLYLPSNDIEKIENLDEQTNLQSLHLLNNNIQKIENLYHLKRLQRLLLQNNRIEKIEGLDSLKKLLVLNLDDNKITKIEGLENLEDIKTLKLKGNKISSIEGLNQNKKLELVNVINNDLESVDGVADFVRNSPNCVIEITNPSVFLEQGNYEKTFKYQIFLTQIDIDNYKHWFNLSKYGLYVNQPKEVIHAAQMTLQLNKNAIGIEANLALGYLLNNEFEKAKAIYLKWKGILYLDQEQTWNDIFLEDIKTLKAVNISHPDFEKVIELLKQE
jgi:Leucine-rich repeat (LRR) protein